MWWWYILRNWRIERCFRVKHEHVWVWLFLASSVAEEVRANRDNFCEVVTWDIEESVMSSPSSSGQITTKVLNDRTFSKHRLVYLVSEGIIFKNEKKKTIEAVVGTSISISGRSAVVAGQLIKNSFNFSLSPSWKSLCLIDRLPLVYGRKTHLTDSSKTTLYLLYAAHLRVHPGCLGSVRSSARI